MGPRPTGKKLLTDKPPQRHSTIEVGFKKNITSDFKFEETCRDPLGKAWTLLDSTESDVYSIVGDKKVTLEHLNILKVDYGHYNNIVREALKDVQEKAKQERDSLKRALWRSPDIRSFQLSLHYYYGFALPIMNSVQMIPDWLGVLLVPISIVVLALFLVLGAFLVIPYTVDALSCCPPTESQLKSFYENLLTEHPELDTSHTDAFIIAQLHKISSYLRSSAPHLEIVLWTGQERVSYRQRSDEVFDLFLLIISLRDDVEVGPAVEGVSPEEASVSDSSVSYSAGISCTSNAYFGDPDSDGGVDGDGDGGNGDGDDDNGDGGGDNGDGDGGNGDGDGGDGGGDGGGGGD
jgi:uncharacterized membrane protein YgcG